MRQLAHMRFQTSPPPAGAAYSLLRGAEEEGAEEMEMEDKGLGEEYDKDNGARKCQAATKMDLNGTERRNYGI